MPGSAVPAEAAPSRDDPTGREPDHRWLAGVWILVTGFALLTALRSEHAGIPLRDPRGSILVSRIAISLGPLLLLAVVDAGVRIGRRGWQADMLLEALRVKWSGERVRLALGGLLAYHIVYFCYHNLKSWDVFNLPRDDMLLRWDRWLFLGHDPATLLHDLLGQHVAAYVLMGVYESFSTLTAVSVVAALVFTTRIRDGYVFIASAMWVWILGVGSYYLIPSLGPFESDPTVYAGLPHTMIQDTQTLYLAQRAHLLAHPHSADGFAQVSAFASLHVAVTCLILLMARYHGLRRTTRALLVFLVGTILATVYLGWHFAVDDVAGLVIAFVAVLLGRLTTYPCGRPPVRTAA